MSQEIDVDGGIKPRFDYNMPLELTRKPLSNPASQHTFSLEEEVTRAMISDDIKYPRMMGMSNQYDSGQWAISSDHCYARPWNWRPEENFLRPTKTLFIHKAIGKRSVNPLAPVQDVEDIVDVESEGKAGTIYDLNKAKSLMDECEKYAFNARVDQDEDDWEDKISKGSWSPAQYRIFSGMASILNNLNLARLANKKVSNEPVLRRTAVDKAVQRVRRLLATVSWDPKITQWLHQMLIDNLGPHYLTCYLDILQTLKSKLPNFVDKMMYGPNSSLRMGALNNVNLQPLLERSWDPAQAISSAVSHISDRPKKLPGSPVLIVIPSAPVLTKMSHKWIKLMGYLGTVVAVPTNYASILGQRASSTTTAACLDHMYAAVRAKLDEARTTFPGRPVVLVGVRAGASLALRLAKAEPGVATCVVAIGFSLLTAEGRRGEPEDEMLELHSPVLFVVGEKSDTSTQEDLEDLRERMRVETGLIVVGSADDYLRISKKKKKAEGVTQSIVDKCIVEEIGEFCSGLIMSPFPPTLRQSPPTASVVHHPADANIPMRKGKPPIISHSTPTSSQAPASSSSTSTSSSPTGGLPPGSPLDDSSGGGDRATPPPSAGQAVGRSPTNKKSPSTMLGRPPGARTMKPRVPPPGSLEAKWAQHQQQLAQGNTPSSTPTPPTHPRPPSRQPSSPSPSPPPQQATPERRAVRIGRPPKVRDGDGSPSPVKRTPVRKLGPMVVQRGAITPEKQARLQAYTLNRTASQGGSRLSNLLQGGIKTLPPKQPSGIKVLENVSLNSSTAAKMMQNRTLDMSKMSVVNTSTTSTAKTGTASGNIGNVLLLPDGKLKTVSGGTVKGATATPSVGGTPVILPFNPQRGSPKRTASTAIGPPPGNKFITAKRQLLGSRPRPIKKPYLPVSSTATSVPPQQILPPPTNLTTQDILDLPIIFADDNQIIQPTNIGEDLGSTVGTSSTSQPVAAASIAAVSTATPVTMAIAKPALPPATKVIPSTPSGKYMVLNRPANQSNFIITSTGLKKSTTPVTFGKPSPKYTKIILSSKKVSPEQKPTPTKIQCLSPDVTIKKLHQESPRKMKMAGQSSIVELIDLENEIKATAVPKPNLPPGVEKACAAQIIHKKLEIATPMKRQSPSPLELADDTDPDYIPPKNLKLD
ncbi:unnamed protein product [Acanthoscelides obtectus]|uniref:KAT8 regulatory NSL complex subunit 3 n=1 Tax=Acanthoscelides obtectus TaxID=200917 RepID=A0A9P0ME27_ACAOB|nr:unnamed protein product [Acanthoscelides obtectus]CAK1630138.1 KAT8 regulatory NSL complex subunit 3 [Acanthoscelides obtectus]